MTNFTIIWKIREGDIHEQEFRGYADKIDAMMDWIIHQCIDMNKVEWYKVNET